MLKTALPLSLLAISMCSCGTVVPQIHEPWEESDEVDFDLVNRIKRSIYCELRTSVHDLGRLKGQVRGPMEDAIPDSWGVQETLKLTMDETGSVNPSASYNETFRTAVIPLRPPVNFPQSFSLPISAQLSSQAVRIDSYYSFYSAKGLKSDFDEKETSCSDINDPHKPMDRHGSSYLLTGNVGIKSWLKSAIQANYYPPSSAGATFKDGVIQYDIKFVVITAGTVNPTWRLAPVSTAVGNLPLVSGNRTRTHDLLLTFGPADVKKGKASPSAQSIALHSAGQTEQSVSSAFRSVLQQP
ncbi:hypothetical protein LOK46_07830 [Methylobacterium sp. NMS14P]|uniref:hypothetical protein n=1 Tax=Methylobacterium sp. NMS14P TaxID=2894310 RepID=UPI0023589533|nr:hypothetical protein [Methylobacterium sp. NMS14P]WCS26722.1 hypothetical protein LOK46_07830 [Methylobacterium sp. NMS14P]